MDDLPHLTTSRAINLQEKINHLLYLPRQIQAGGKGKHGYAKLLSKTAGIEKQIAGLDLPKGGGFLDCGCGTHDPLALAVYYCLNGLDFAYAVDVSPPRNPAYSAFSMYDILANIRSFPRRYCREGVSPTEIITRLEELPIEQFEKGDFSTGLSRSPDHLRYETCGVEKSTVQPESLGLIVSFAVLEHVDDLAGVCRKLYDSLMPGGIAYHFIDLVDHRSYAADGKYHALSFLTEKRRRQK